VAFQQQDRFDTLKLICKRSDCCSPVKTRFVVNTAATSQTIQWQTLAFALLVAQ